jgi:hypothetical protein
MNTPSHVAVNFLVLAKKGKPQWSLPIVMGSLMPDIPIYLFYFYQKIIAGMSERTIWVELYFRPSWQNFFDPFHSFPVLLLAATLSYNDDAHRHFFPISDYRFLSPLSYWDSRHYGGLVSIIESLFVLCFSAIIWFRGNTRWHKVVPVLVLFFSFFGYFVAMFLWS